jgi:hypothetical protein
MVCDRGSDLVRNMKNKSSNFFGSQVSSLFSRYGASYIQVSGAEKKLRCM